MYKESLPVISLEDLQLQQDYLNSTFLNLPTNVSIFFVNDLDTIRNAREILLQKNSDGKYVNSFLGVDAEWKTTIPVSNKRNKSDNNNKSDNSNNTEIIEDDIQDCKEDTFVSGGNNGGASILQVKIS